MCTYIGIRFFGRKFLRDSFERAIMVCHMLVLDHHCSLPTHLLAHLTVAAAPAATVTSTAAATVAAAAQV